MKFRQLVTVTTTSLLLNTLCIDQAKAAESERWFEMEVILFSQLDDKSKLKEAFPDEIPLPKFRKVWDLLPGYLNPNISSLKQQLPHCEDPVYPQNLVSQASKLPNLFEYKTLLELEQSAEQVTENSSENSAEQSLDLISDENTVNTLETYQEINQGNNQGNNQDSNLGIEVSTVESIYEEKNNELAGEIDIILSEDELALISQAEQQFSPIQLDMLATPTFTKDQKLCAISEVGYNKLASNVEHTLAYNGFTLTSVPRSISAVENLYSAKPYLLNDESLKLHDIVKQLSRSKNFRPLLHVGWRQAPKGRNKSIPVKLFAGENFADSYQKAQQAYLDAKEASQAQELMLQNILLTDQGFDNLGTDSKSTNQQHADKISPEEQQQLVEQQLRQARIEQILLEIDSTPINVQEIIETIDDPSLQLSAENDVLMLDNAPKAPPQPWFLEGFFNVHLNHYLYITADFNVLNMDMAQYATQQLQPNATTELKPIRFQQNRRVISGEIHYFDHPYMGMIVQIRRHKRPEPEEATTDPE